MTATTRQRISSLIIVAFFLSGFTSLVYEIIWVRMLTRYVGGSTFSVTIVLTVFMAGLALGSRLAARFVDKLTDSHDLVRLYGVIEAAIGVYAAIFPVLLRACKPLYALLYRLLQGDMILFGTSSAIISILLLILPTTLMGATLPLLARYYVQELGRVGTRTGRLYGINTIGAALGSLICGVIMLRWLGTRISLSAAVTVNIVIGIVFVALVRKGAGLAGLARRITQAVRAPVIVLPQPSQRGVIFLLAVSGACSMAYEVIWTKLLALLVGPTTYSFTLVLFTFITGLALGSLLFGWLGDRVRNPFGLLVVTQLAAAATALACSQFLGNSQMFFAKLLYSFRGHLPLLETAKGVAVFLAMLPTTLMLGAVFPLATRVETRDATEVGAVVGRLYMFNTIGAVIGSLSAGFFLVPLFGKADSLSALAVIQVAAPLLVLWFASTRTINRPARLSLSACGLLLLALCFVFPRWDQYALTRGRYHRFDEFSDQLKHLGLWKTAWSRPSPSENMPDTSKHPFLEDGIGGFVSVAESVNGFGITNVFLTISGKTDASTDGDIHTMTLTGQVPMLLHPKAKTAMVVGLASGITAGEMLHYPLQQLDVLEISPEVVKACRYFDPWNNGVLDDSRTRVILQDARTHMLLSDTLYDVIVSEPSNPWMAGVANLFTTEYFHDVRDHLASDGIFVQWYHAYQTDWESFCLVGRTLSGVFPNNCIIRTSTIGSDYLMIAFADDTRLPERMERIREAMPYAQLSQNMVMPTPDVLLPLVVAENPMEIYGTGQLHTDAQPRLEFVTLHGFYKEKTDILFQLMDRARVSPYVTNGMRALSDPSKRLDLAEFMGSMDVQPFGLAGLQPDATPEHLSRRKRIIENYAGRNRGGGYNRILDPQEKTICLAVHEEVLEKHLATAVQNGREPQLLALIHFDIGNVHVAREDWVAAIQSFRRAEVLFPDYSAALANLATCHERLGQHLEAAGVYEQLVRIKPFSAMLWARFAATHLRLGQVESARRLFEQALSVDPNCAPALTATGSMMLQAGQLEESIRTLDRAIQADPHAVRPYQNIAIALAKAGRTRDALSYIERGLAVKPGNRLLVQMRTQLISAK